MSIKRVGILTGGGDCSGLNAVIRAVTRAAIIQHGAKVIGIEGGFEGLISGQTQVLTTRSTKDILTLGGTILGTTNKGNPFEYRERDTDGNIRVSDRSDEAVETFKALKLDCLFVVGGEGTLEIGYKFYKKGIPVIGIPKTIDNDLEVRTTVLGHIQRGGSPNSFDRVLGTRLGSFAVDSAARGKFGTMVALKTPDIVLVDLKDLAGKVRCVPVDSQLIRCAESIGVNMGREAM